MKKLLLLLFIIGCNSEITQPSLNNISGRYSNSHMILYLSELNSRCEADLDAFGYIQRLVGTYDRTTSHLVLSNAYFSFSLFYNNNKLAGAYTTYEGSKEVELQFDHKINKLHDQGGS